MSDNFRLPGEVLREEREKQQLSERDVANKLHLSTNYVQALEADDYEHLPEATFIKGYIRNYAKLLGVPADPLLKTFDSMRAPVIKEPQESEPVGVALGRYKAWILLLVVAVVMVVIWLLLTGGDSQDATKGDREPAAVTLSDSKAAATLGHEQTTAESVAAAAKEAAAAEAVAAMQAVKEATPVVAESAADRPTPVVTVDQLQIRFDGNCWVEVSDASGDEMYQGSKSAGAVLELTGEAPFALTLGNAGAVTGVSVNGQAVELPPLDSGEVVHLQVP